MSDRFLERVTLSAHSEEAARAIADRPATLPARTARGHLTLIDYGRSEWAEKPVVQRLRRPRIGLYDIAVILLIVVSLAAVTVCLARMG